LARFKQHSQSKEQIPAKRTMEKDSIACDGGEKRMGFQKYSYRSASRVYEVTKITKRAVKKEEDKVEDDMCVSGQKNI
jgi:hypothetical protein